MKKLIEAREAKVAELDGLVSELDEMEAGEEFDGKFARSNELHAEIKDMNVKIDEAREAAETLKAVKESRNALGVEDEDLGDKEAVVEVNEPDLYRNGGDHSFISDAWAARSGDFKAQERLNKHQDFEARDVGTGAFTGLVVPQYLVDEYAPIARAGSPFYNAVPKKDLPAFGNKIEISRITTGSAAAEQASENSAVQETNMDDTLLTVNVQEINSNRFAPATAILMHPRRWGFLTAGVDSSNRPLVLPAGNNPDNAAGVGEAAAYGQVVGSVLGLPVITDANIRTDLGAGTEDAIYIAKVDDHIMFEDNLFQLKFEETNAGSLTTKMVVYGYVAFASGRYPKGISAITGTGLIAPTF